MATSIRLLLFIALTLGLAACPDTEVPNETPPTCSDGVQNGDESDIDCGGSTCVLCESGQTCDDGADCASDLCDAGVCACPDGQEPSAMGGCEDTDECAEELDDCDASATCVNTAPGYTCECETGTVMTNGVCEPCAMGLYGDACVETCDLSDCETGGTCDPVTGALLTCETCPQGLWGELCDASCDPGNCTGAITCDPTDGTVLACEDGCIAGSYGPVCDLECASEHCIACNTEDACAVGSQCLGGICLSEVGQDCDDNDTCTDVCVANVCADPSRTGLPCETSNDCSEPGLHECTDGVCLFTGGTTCEYDDECIGVCLGGLCAPKSATGAFCEDADDCDDGNDCLDGTCLRVEGSDCDADDQCIDACITNTCTVASDLFGACDATNDCLSGLVCNAGTCLLTDGTACEMDAVCQGTCVRSVCAGRSPTQAACDDTADCEQQHACTNDQCLRVDEIACGVNNDCINACITDTCAPRSEIGGVCDEDDDCVTGASCFDDVCLFDDGQQCTENDQCASACINDVCRDRSDTGGPCDESPDCVDAHQCLGGTCFAEDDEDCGLNADCVNVCITDTCAPQSDLYGACDEDDDCVTGHVCDPFGVCKLAEGGECTTAEDCATVNTDCIADACLTDASPDSFSFDDQSCIPPSADVFSNTVTLGGFYGPLPLTSVSDGDASVLINGVASPSPTTVVAGDTVSLQVTAPSTEQATTTATVTLGELDRSWDVSTAPNIAPGTEVAAESGVMGTNARSGTGASFTVPVTAIYDVGTYMQCRDRIHNGEYYYTLCSARLERLVGSTWTSVVSHSHTNGQCCRSQGWVLNRSTATTLSADSTYRFRYFASGRTGGTTTIYGSSASVAFQTCE